MAKQTEREIKYSTRKDRDDLIEAIIQDSSNLLGEVMTACGLQFIIPDDGIPAAISREQQIINEFHDSKDNEGIMTYKYAEWRKLVMENRQKKKYTDVVDLHNFPDYSMAAEKNPLAKLKRESWHDAVKNPPVQNKRVIVKGILENHTGMKMREEGVITTFGCYEGVENMEDVWTLDLEIPHGCTFEVKQWKLLES